MLWLFRDDYLLYDGAMPPSAPGAFSAGYIAASTVFTLPFWYASLINLGVASGCATCL